MVTKLLATFDGKALLPEGPTNLKPHTRYTIVVEGEAPGEPSADNVPDVLAEIAALATDMGVTDLAERHTEYARGRKFGGKLPG